MRILYPLNVVFQDYPNNFSIPLGICMMGCDHLCIECQSPEFRNYEYVDGCIDITVSAFIDIVWQRLVVSHIHDRKIVISGGDPLSPRNIEETKELLLALKFRGVDSIVYTGYGIDYVKANKVKGFTYIKCGLFLPHLRQESKKTDQYIQFASTNQELYDVNYTLLSSNGVYYFEEKCDV